MTHFPSSPADSLTASSVRLCKEVFEDDYQPSKDEINDYARKIGIDPDKEPHLLHIAVEGLMKALPEEWKPCFSEQYKAYYYYNVHTKQSQWIHPQDELFKQKVQEARKRLHAQQADTTSEEVDSGIRSGEMEGTSGGGGRGMEKRLGGKFLAPLVRTTPQLPTPLAGGGNESKPIGRVDQIRRQFDVQRVTLEEGSDARKPTPPVKGFTLTGTGSMFLKSSATAAAAKKLTAEKDQEEKPGKPSTNPFEGTTPSVKGILRDSSLTDVHVRHRSNESGGGELEKSVRFSLAAQTSTSSEAENNKEPTEVENGEGAPKTPLQRPSSALNKNLKLDSDSDASTNTTTSDEEEEFEEVVVEEEEEATGEDDEDAWTPRKPSCGIKVITSAKQPSTAEMKPQTEVKTHQMDRKKQLLEEERQNFDAELKRIRAMNKEKLQQFIADEEKALQRLLEAKREEMEIDKQSSLTVIESQLEAKLQSVRAEIEESYSVDAFRNELMQEFEMKRRAVVEEHKTSVEVLERNHQEILEDLERDLRLQEDLVRKEHATKLAELKAQLTHELETERAKMRESGDDRMYEKMRCEKRLLEDKYRCLKDRYNRLKTDVKLSVEKRNNRRREQQQQQLMNHHQSEAVGDRQKDSSTDRRTAALEKKNSCGDRSQKTLSAHQNRPANNNNPQHTEDTTSISISDTTMSNTHPRMNYSAPLGVDDSDSEAFFMKSDNNQQRHSIPYHRKSKAQHGEMVDDDLEDQQEEGDEHSPRGRKKTFSRTKSASTSRLHSSKVPPDLCAVPTAAPCTPMEALRRQLKKLEDLEDQLPDNTLEVTYHLRYPFGMDTATTNYENTSSELEFFKHRIHLERDALCRAKTSLKAQRDSFRAKREKLMQRQHCATVEELMAEEKELTEMEVNLHRNRALLGEKVIRLRHLEQSLQRFVEHKTDAATLSDLSSHSSSGFSSTDFILSGGAEAAAAGGNKLRRTTTVAAGTGSVESTTDILKNLETLNSEIREIWEILKQTTTQTSGSGNYYNASELDWSFNANTPHLPLTPNLAHLQEPLMRTTRNFSSLLSQSPTVGAGHYTSTLVERTRDLRNWLRQAKQEHLLAQKQTQI